MSHEYKRPESALVIVHTQQQQVLLLHRHEPAHFWQSVAGSLLWDETPFEAAVRELFEETGLDADNIVDCKVKNRFVIYPVWRERYAPGVIENIEYIFRLGLDEICPITLDAREHGEYKWVYREQALEMVTSHTNRDAIDRWVI